MIEVIALHGYLKHLCSRALILVDDDDPTITVLFEALRNQHPPLIAQVPYSDERKKLLSSMSAGLDALGAMRNHGSLAQKAVLHYLEAKLSARQRT